MRTEFGYSQDRMATQLGISKKTLVEIEKGRKSLGWSGSVTLCTLFGEGDVLQSAFGGRPIEMILSLTFEDAQQARPKPFGERIWWIDIESNDTYIIQQNILSQHYRLLSRNNERIMSSLRLDDIMQVFAGTGHAKGMQENRGNDV